MRDSPDASRAPAQTARLSTFAALKARNYCLYWVGLVFYVLGHRAEYVTFAWITWEVTHDPLSLGYLGLAQGVPLVVFQLFGGVLADRTNRLRLLIGTQVLTALTLTVAFGLTVLGLVRVELLLALAALSNTFRAFDEPSRLSLIPQLIDRERLPNAIALGSIPWQAGRMIGPSITGVLIAAFGGAVGFGLAAVASYTALVLYSRLRPAGSAPAGDGQRLFRQLVEGLSFVGGNFVFTSLIGLALFNSLFALSYITLLPIYADWYFHTGSTGYGLLQAAHGSGALLGTLTVATIAHRIPRPGTALLIGATCLGLLLMVFSRAPWMELALAVLVLVGFSNTFYLTQVSTILQQAVPDQLRGRVMSLYSLCWNLLPLGGLLAGVLAAAVDARFAVLVGGAMVAANALLLLTSRRLRALS
ncbi:MAG: MFS transporter [Candidatus Rokubacteria bacterium]|nr:MFS transporter [Candidatus Rokubacteria bacterium]